MDFVAVVDQVIALLRQRGRMTYRTLQRQFQLDDDALDDLKDELLYAHPEVRDDAGRGLIWSRDTDSVPAATPAPAGTPAPAPLAYTPPYLAEKILTSRSALEGERKQVTVLFADLKGSVELLAERDPEEALRLATLEGRGTAPTIAHGCLGYLYLTQGDLAHAVPVFDQGLALCRASGNRTWWRVIAAGLGYAAALQGRLTEGHTLLEETIREDIRMGALQGHASRVAWLSEVCGLAGHGEEAWQYARQALDLARQHKERANEAFALHQLGGVHAHADPPNVEQAAAHYQQALALAGELGMRPLVAHCHRGLGMLYATVGQQEQARAALSTAIDLYRAMDMTFWLPEAEAALAQVDAR